MTTAIANQDYRLAMLHVGYGQRTEQRELRAFNALADFYHAEHRLVRRLGNPKADFSAYSYAVHFVKVKVHATTGVARVARAANTATMTESLRILSSLPAEECSTRRSSSLDRLSRVHERV